MTNDQIKAVAAMYRDRLAPTALDRAACEEEVGRLMQTHVVWMCEQLPVLVDEDRLDKANRWLGFVQGFLWPNGFYTIDEMKDHNRSKDDAKTPSGNV
jgi:hypothetical protein